MKIILTLIIFLLSGCSVTTPSTTDYRIDPKVTIDDKTTSTKQSIKIAPLFTNVSLSTNSMRYRVGDYKEYTFTQSAWVDNPNRSIANHLVHALQNSGLFEGVYSYKSSKSADLLLEVSIDEFIQSFNEAEDSSSVTLSISYNLIEKKTSKLLGAKNFTKTMQTKTVDAQGGVEALNTLLSQTLEETTIWLGKSL
ncbi:ABC-type transport auxiliary lipoprotein family protein [Sulfurimonas sp.]|uniref:ABC-type transport auxiliary lipoprotein family protein n=1 Tax=Sulfurimonas sp. TaxID=2022749 RepID=UPI003D0E6592